MCGVRVLKVEMFTESKKLSRQTKKRGEKKSSLLSSKYIFVNDFSVKSPALSVMIVLSFEAVRKDTIQK